MYKINHKMIFISILTQMAFGFFWLTAAPTPLISIQPDISLALTALACVVSFVYFYAWLISRLRSSSRWEMGAVAISLWLFCVLPNVVITHLLFDLSLDVQIYTLAFSAVATLLNAIILPFSRSSRSIFKG
ncbi:hypothetical protein [Marinomonas sp. S3726]|uniref:hypothetical protein n=1 Tax=Marinomonas sp. S3726 TaxID=579484 RepID=UPI0012F6A99D|nr:hypothetical protein [Marinomonas sp. S3726]